jgi:hypothetical protein
MVGPSSYPESAIRIQRAADATIFLVAFLGLRFLQRYQEFYVFRPGLPSAVGHKAGLILTIPG